MKLQGYKKMSVKKQEITYGGWMWLAVAMPFLVEGFLTLTSTYKAFNSDEGSVKTKSSDVKWKNTQTKTSNSSTSKSPKRIFYVF